MFPSGCLCKCSCPFRGWSPHVSFAAPLSFWPSPLFSLVMSLSWCESLGYQCSASDRKHMINKLSCFSSPLYPPSFFLKWGLLLLPMTPPQHIIPLFPLPFLLCCLLPWIAGSHRCVTIITRTFRKKIMLFPPFNMFCSKIGREIERGGELKSYRVPQPLT